MKQCPNPNCIFYTRLEELPDAYIKCPGCGGMLAEAGMMSGPLTSGSYPSTRSTSSAYTVPGAVDTGLQQGDETYAYNYAQAQQPADPFAPVGAQGQGGAYPPAYEPYTGPQAYPAAPPDPYAQAYVDPDGSARHMPVAGQRPRWTTGSKVVVGLSVLLLLTSCVVVAVLFSNRLFPQSRLILTSGQATETAIASLRPALNTPIIVPPTVTLGEPVIFTPVPQPTRPPEEPTAVVLPTTAPEAPTQAPVPPTVPPAPVLPTPAAGPTAPPPQPQPQAGVIAAQMSVSLEGGTPVGEVSAYGPTDTLNLAVQANYGPGAVTSVVTKWYDPNGAHIYEMRREYTQPGTYYAGFTLRTSGRWAPGTYRVDIHTNDAPTPSYSVNFTVLP